MSDLLLERAATISECGLYRYGLERRWDRRLGQLPIIMLNPSTADADLDDPTIRRCMSFARRQGFGGISVANRFAYRATSPAEMKAASDPFGPEGSDAIEALLQVAAQKGRPVLAAWGSHGGFRDRDEMVKLSAKGWGTDLVCLGTTKDGYPKHPSMSPEIGRSFRSGSRHDHHRQRRRRRVPLQHDPMLGP